MLLQYGGSQGERFEYAIQAGTLIVCIKPSNVLSLDLDKNPLNEKEYSKFYEFCGTTWFKYARSNPGNTPSRAPKPLTTTSISGSRYHMYIPLRGKMPLQEYHDWAVRLGSDPERERYSLERELKAQELSQTAKSPDDWKKIDGHPWVLFETPSEFKKVKEWYEKCGFAFTYISYVDPDTKTYDTNRENVPGFPKRVYPVVDEGLEDSVY